MTENRFTFAVDRKPEGRYALSRVGLIGLYVLFLVVGFCVFYAVRMPQVFAVCPLLLLILVFYTWRYTQVTNEYEIEIGQISFARIYGNRTRRNAMTLRIKDLVSAGPGKGGNGRYAHVYDFRGSVHSPDTCYLVYRNDKDEAILVLFEGTQKAFRRGKSEKTGGAQDLQRAPGIS